VQYLLISKDYYPYHYGGMANYYRGYADGFGDDIRVLIPGNNSILPDGQIDHRVVPIYTRSNNPSSFFHRRTVYRKAARLIEEGAGPWVVLCGNFRPYADVCYWLKKKYNVAVYPFFHGNDLLRVLKRLANNPLKRWKYDKLFLACDGFIANSRYTMSLIPEEHKYKKKIIIAPPGVDAGYAHRSIKEPLFAGDYDIRLITVCRLDHRKGVHNVIESVKILKERGISCYYDVIGKGNVERYRSIASSSGVADRVAIHGYKNETDKIALLKVSDIFIMPSQISEKNNDVEGFGIVYLEASAFGKPVVAANTGGIPDAVIDGRNGLLVRDPDDPVEIADKIETLYRDKNMAIQLGRHGHERVNKKFLYPSLAEALKKEISKQN